MAAVFPTVPRDNEVSIFVNNSWVDVSADLYHARDGIIIKRGSRDEQGIIPPTSCQLTLKNTSGNYSPRNPNGAYFGSLGRNTPIRYTIGKDKDGFADPASNGWGITDNGFAWSFFGGVASNYAVSGGTATHSISATNQVRTTYVPSQLYGDIEVTVDVTLSLSSVTGTSAAVGVANLIVRGVDSNNYLVADVRVQTGVTNYTVDLLQVVGGVATSILDAPIDTGVPYAANTPVRVRAGIEGRIFRVKVWPPGGPEPYRWSAGQGTNTAPAAMGWVGVQSYVNSSVTNTLPITISYTNWGVRIKRFAGEVSYWPQRWDNTGADVYTTIEASGIKRRVGQGNAPIASAMTSGISKLDISGAKLLTYWPCEDGLDSSQFLPNVGSYPLNVAGTTKFAQYDRFLCSNPLPTVQVGTWQGKIAPYTAANTGITVHHLIHIPTTEPADTFPILQVFVQGNAPQWEVKYRTGGDLQLNAWAPSGLLADSGEIGVIGLVDKHFLLTTWVYQSGSDAIMRLWSLELGASVAFNWQLVATNRTVGTVTSVVIDPYQKMKDVTIGHVGVWDGTLSPYFLQGLINARSGYYVDGGETTADRIWRLSTEAGVPIDFAGDRLATPLAGPQRSDGFLSILEDCADAEGGILIDQRSNVGLKYRTLARLYNQAAALTLDYSAKQVFAPFEPVDDDQQTRNYIVANRDAGGRFELFQSQGRLAITDPWQGGVGTYSDQRNASLAFDDQLRDYAGWHLNLGTVDESRYPSVTVKLHSPTMASLENAALTVDVGDRIVITNPKIGQTADPISQIVRGYIEMIKPFEHTIEYLCAPAAPYDVVRANVTGMMTVDTDGSTLAATVNATATTISVTSTGTNQRWITGTVNFDIVVEGERMTVTNISGTTQTQTFTVIRSVNGIVKAHNTVGVPVTLYRAARVAY